VLATTTASETSTGLAHADLPELRRIAPYNQTSLVIAVFYPLGVEPGMPYRPLIKGFVYGSGAWLFNSLLVLPAIGGWHDRLLHREHGLFCIPESDLRTVALCQIINRAVDPASLHCN
jgi:hypothetical protein